MASVCCGGINCSLHTVLHTLVRNRLILKCKWEDSLSLSFVLVMISRASTSAWYKGLPDDLVSHACTASSGSFSSPSLLHPCWHPTPTLHNMLHIPLVQFISIYFILHSPSSQMTNCGLRSLYTSDILRPESLTSAQEKQDKTFNGEKKGRNSRENGWGGTPLPRCNGCHVYSMNNVKYVQDTFS